MATAIAIGGTPGDTHPFPFGANVSAPAQYFLTVHGRTAALTDAVKRRGGARPGAERQRRSRPTPDHGGWCPTASGTRAPRRCASPPAWGCGTQPPAPTCCRARSPAPLSREAPGKPAPPPAFFDVAFPLQRAGADAGNAGPRTTTDPAWWRESAQAQALASGDISSFHAEVDFAKLGPRTSTTTCPTSRPACRRAAPSTASSPRTSPTGRARTTRPAAAAARPPASGRCAASCCPTRSTCRAGPEPRAAGARRCCCTRCRPTTTSSRAPRTSRSSPTAARARS